ncbi:unnamed protein product [Pedinophyceae sp. YPF-701]|nr:unnamed protein product [Pedinophyceae sp. YPF-701]
MLVVNTDGSLAVALDPDREHELQAVSWGCQSCPEEREAAVDRAVRENQARRGRRVLARRTSRCSGFVCLLLTMALVLGSAVGVAFVFVGFDGPSCGGLFARRSRECRNDRDNNSRNDNSRLRLRSLLPAADTRGAHAPALSAARRRLAMGAP